MPQVIVNVTTDRPSSQRTTEEGTLSSISGKQTAQTESSTTDRRRDEIDNARNILHKKEGSVSGKRS